MSVLAAVEDVACDGPDSVGNAGGMHKGDDPDKADEAHKEPYAWVEGSDDEGKVFGSGLGLAHNQPKGICSSTSISSIVSNSLYCSAFSPYKTSKFSMSVYSWWCIVISASSVSMAMSTWSP